MKEAETDQMTVEQWLATRKEAGIKIDPETAEVDWTYALTLDPLRGLPRPAGGIPASWTGVFCPFCRKRHMGQLWRSARGNRKSAVGKA